ncbi:hypothetical protein KCU81_g377, partial [Aureobasidium melanogenum]
LGYNTQHINQQHSQSHNRFVHFLFCLSKNTSQTQVEAGRPVSRVYRRPESKVETSKKYIHWWLKLIITGSNLNDHKCILPTQLMLQEIRLKVGGKHAG